MPIQVEAFLSAYVDGSSDRSLQKGEWRMATLTAVAFNLFETIGFVQPCIQVMVRETTEYSVGLQPLRMRWVRELDSNGRRVTRIQWIEDKQREEIVNAVVR
jgi:hypothetical protein